MVSWSHNVNNLTLPRIVSASGPLDCNTDQAPPGAQLCPLQVGRPFPCLLTKAHVHFCSDPFAHVRPSVQQGGPDCTWLVTWQREMVMPTDRQSLHFARPTGLSSETFHLQPTQLLCHQNNGRSAFKPWASWQQKGTRWVKACSFSSKGTCVL